MTADLKTFIKRAMARGERIDVGQFRLVNLAAVREKAGDHWPSAKKKVFAAGTQFLAKRLSDDDAVIPCEEGFLVLFAEAPDDPATFLAELGEALMAFFLGATETAALGIESAASRVAADEITQLATASTTPPSSSTSAPDKTSSTASPLPRSRPVAECEDGDVLAHYRPLWDAQKQSIAINAALAKVVVGGRALEGRRAISTGMSKVSHFDLDACALDTAIAMMTALARKQKRITLRIALHASCWSDRDHRAALSARIEALPEPARKSLLVRIDGLTDQPQKQAMALAELGQLGVGLMAEIPFGATELDAFSGCSVSLFSCASPAPSNANSEGMMDHDARALNLMVKAAAAHSAATYMHDVRDLLVLKAAMASGVRFFSGQSVVPDRTAPAPGQPLSMVDLYRMHKAA
ncbi:hypothetical protein [uncultured Maricaulis sp.]|uniref:hypothetical protein n=1 Tax=uncultured Maricaulis sp. TaxID=174710 RepID=UPI0026225CB3|nr:hypothetical protein [uncultured Maricaulis sp.]